MSIVRPIPWAGGQQVTGFDLFTVADFDTRLGRQVVEVEDLAVEPSMVIRGCVRLWLDDDELRDAALAALALFFEAGGFAFSMSS